MHGTANTEKGSLKKKAGNASIASVVKTVAAGFLGIRKQTEHERETVHLSPRQIILTGLFGAAVFVVSLVLLAKFVVGKATG